MKHSVLSILSSCLVIAVAVACSAASTTPPNSPPASQATPARITVVSTSLTNPTIIVPTATTAPTKLPTPVSPTSALEAIAYPKNAGLDRLDSYGFTLRLSFKGKQDGQPLETREVYTRTFSSNPAAVVTASERMQEDGSWTTMLVASVGGVQYFQGGPAGQCTAHPNKPGSVNRDYDPAETLLTARAGKFVGQETVNGVPTRHYAIDKASFESIQAAQVSGDIWIAESGPFVAKYNLRVSGGEEQFGMGTSGEATMTFELRDAGAKKPVVLPNACPSPNPPA